MIYFSLDPEKRFTRLCKNLCLLLTALFHFIHNIVSPVLMSLGASHNYNGRRQILRSIFKIDEFNLSVII